MIRSFIEVPLEVLLWVYRVGWDRPRVIQTKALPLLLANPPRNAIIQSQSGTGKTVASIILMLSRVNPDLEHPQVIYLTPTDRLAQKTKRMMLEHANIAVQTRMEQIIIGTPDIVQGLISRGELITANIVLCVMDDVDLLHQLYPQETSNIQRELPPSCQQVAFSAVDSQVVMGFAAQHMLNPITVQQLESLSNIKQVFVVCDQWHDKVRALFEVFKAVSPVPASTIIFCNMVGSAILLKRRMIREGYSVALTTEDEDDALDRFRESKVQVLITTNPFITRGIVMEPVKMLINFDVPMVFNNRLDCEVYLHRFGNVGQLGRSRLVINFMARRHVSSNLVTIARHFGCLLKELDIDDPDELYPWS